MRVELLSVKGTWRDIADACNTTIGIDPGDKEPSEKWKRTILKCEHSPIRKMSFNLKLHDIPSYVSVHLVRHKIGIEHFVRSQRTDRTGTDRSKLPQDSLVTHEIDANLQALITISRKRLCSQADPMTRGIWRKVCQHISEYDYVIGQSLVPECVYRGFCPEFKCCGYVGSEKYEEQLKRYRGEQYVF